MQCYFLGPPASYTHQAALKAFPEATLQACSSIPAVFNTVRDADAAGSAALSADGVTGIVPVENSTNGPVAATLDLLADTANDSTDVQIVGEVHVPVRHCLLGKRRPDQAPSAIPNFSDGSKPDLAYLRSLYTHPQAWGQCKRFLAAYGLTAPSAKPVTTSTATDAPPNEGTTCHDAASTSAAAALAAADPHGQTAAISSALAASAHDLAIILEGLEDSAQNVTRFLVLRNRRASAPASTSAHKSAQDHRQWQLQSAGGPLPPRRRRKALVTFALAPSDPARPGALSETLAVFSARGLSLSSINARPRGGSVPWEYCFIVEIDLGVVGDASSEGDGDGEGSGEGADQSNSVGSVALEAALMDLGRVVGEWQWRGTWDVQGV